jgi:hypothetical protein
VGSLAAGAAAVTGTGAFDQVEAERTVSVETAGDASAYLGLSPGDDKFAQADSAISSDSGTVELVFGSDNNTGEGATGLNARGDTTFNNVLDVANNGTEPVVVAIGFGGEDNVDATLENNLPGSAGVSAFPDEVSGNLEYRGNNPVQTGVYLPVGEDVSANIVFRNIPANTNIDIRGSISVLAVSADSEGISPETSGGTIDTSNYAVIDGSAGEVDSEGS